MTKTKNQKTTNVCLNEDKTLWEKKEDGMVVEKVFLTKDGGVGICHYGKCVVRPVKEWVAKFWSEEPKTQKPKNQKTIEERLTQVAGMILSSETVGDVRTVMAEIKSLISDVLREVIGEDAGEPQTKFQLGAKWKMAKIRRRCRRLGIKI